MPLSPPGSLMHDDELPPAIAVTPSSASSHDWARWRDSSDAIAVPGSQRD